MAQSKPISVTSPSLADEQTAVRVVWQYFMEGRTQADIAQGLSTNRLRINRIINEARRSGLVTITLNSHLASCVALEIDLVREFGLNHAIIVPTPKDPELIPQLLGKTTADYVAHILTTQDIKGIGVGWGATLRETVRNMPAMRRPDLYVNSVMGGLTRGFEINTFDIASDLARHLEAECAYLAAPIFASSAESRAAIMDQDVFREAFDRIAENDLIVLSVGDMTEKSLLMRYGLPRDVAIEELVEAGASGDVMAHFLDQNGQPIDHPINHRSIALSLEALRAVPNVIFTSGGLDKVKAIAAMLLSGLGNALISDEDTARAAFELALHLRSQNAPKNMSK